jgi:Flp pilus assembly protein CpaB
MRRGRIFIYLAFIVILALVAVFVIISRFPTLLGGQETGEILPTPTPIEMVSVVVVTQQVPRGQVLDENVLATIQIPRSAFVEGYFTDLAEVVGRRARVSLVPNMLLTTGMVVDTTEQLSETGSNAALQIPRGMVAVSVPINRLSSVSYALRAGDHVNVIVSLMFVDLDADFQTILPNKNAVVIAPSPGSLETGEGATLTAASQGAAGVQGRAEIDPLLEQTFYVVPSEGQRPRLVAQTLLQDAIVLGVGEFALKDEEAAPQAQAQATPQPEEPAPQQESAPQPTPTPLPKPEVITLIVTPQDAVTLNYLLNGPARISLALRPADDDTRVQTEAATLDFLLKQYNIPVPVKLPYGAESFEGSPQPAPQPTPQPEQ